MADADPEFNAESTWELGCPDAAHDSFFATDYRESEFGWDIPAYSSGVRVSCDAGFVGSDPIEPDLMDPSVSTAEPMVGEASISVSPSNPSFSSSSSHEDPPEKSMSSGVSSAAAAAANPPSETASKSSKTTKGQKRIQQPRFAFAAKSEVDHLEDGYRWRKYGQKAVKNSPFPRSYYRCTDSKCTVKKRIERSSEDPSLVITTYEGQHCHHSVGSFRSSTQDVSFSNYLLNPSSNSQLLHHHHHHHHPRFPQQQHDSLPPVTQSPPNVQGHTARQDDQPPPLGLLGDIVPPGMRNG